MNRRLPTIMILLVSVLTGAMYWMDLSFCVNPATGFVEWGTVWVRYFVVLLPLLCAVFGLRTVGAHALSTLRVKSPLLGGAALIAAAGGLIYAIISIGQGLIFNNGKADIWQIFVGLLYIWYTIWMALVAMHFFRQKSVAPTVSAAIAVPAALPFCAQTLYRVLLNPATLYRLEPFVRNFSALLAMIWFGMLLRGMYIAFTKKRVRWMYMAGVATFLFCTCLELTQTLHTAIYGSISLLQMAEGFSYAGVGLLAGLITIEIAAQPDVTQKPVPPQQEIPSV